MRIALTIWKNRVSPLFDSASELLILDTKGHDIIDRQMESFDNESPFLRAGRLEDLGVNVLICGGISTFYMNLIEARNIHIVPFATGTVQEVLERFMLSNTETL